MTSGNILIVDDNRTVLRALELVLQPEFSKVSTLSNPNRLPFFLQTNSVDVILLDMNFVAGVNTGNEGIFWLTEIKKMKPDIPVVMITAFGDVDLAVKALKMGASDFVLKPWDNNRLIDTLKSAVRVRQSQEKLGKSAGKTEKSDHKEDNVELLGQSSAMKYVFRLIEKVAPTKANVLITGENGTGKELVAQAIHRHSERANKPLVSVDMGAISETLFESELFGHVKGAFTDARVDREGKIIIANGGTLFLDEIGNLSLPLQAKLLAVLENRQVIPVGANRPVSVDIRLICATNCNLEAMVEEGKFREDLLFRMNTIRIEAPPLREREEDIVLLAKHFLEFYGEKYHKQHLTLSGMAREKIRRYSWPGNVRELRHAIEKAVILADGEVLQPEDFHFRPVIEQEEAPTTLEEMERSMIEQALEESGGNMSSAATRLGITRQTLYNKVKKYGL
ncbi:sigma-54-dependent Fis family transcriptional regulator [Prolixibacter bellariivorans]|uniref:Sigma-54-dependent Fis family transcriptional regulator n=1 Tax=Prolixibacter bellariivorans TaxID=314319 RepID=A0A5M4AYG4_9BACT|nr:sigma-54 dependent transcriptional regulator [Prolixibacter bellariivorans]GET32691.1 sigma-54-dependent Fis family transcriptional regulator [Prolixibacter bellariivorans]